MCVGVITTLSHLHYFILFFSFQINLHSSSSTTQRTRIFENHIQVSIITKFSKYLYSHFYYFICLWFFLFINLPVFNKNQPKTPIFTIIFKFPIMTKNFKKKISSTIKKMISGFHYILPNHCGRIQSMDHNKGKIYIYIYIYMQIPTI